MHFLDWLVLILFAVFLLIVGYKSSKKTNSTSIEEYALAGKSASWILVFISIYATSASALTFIGIPGSAFAEDLRYLNLAFGALLGRYCIARLLLPAYFKHNVCSIYELLEVQLGVGVRKSGVIYFFLTRLLASSVRLAACAIAITVIFELQPEVSILLITLIAVGYTQIGGMRAVLWTDLIQFIVFIVSAFIVIFYITSLMPQDFSQLLSSAESGGKLDVFSFSFSGADSLFLGFLFGALINFAALGTDQDLVQRMLTSKTLGESKKALMLSAVAEVPMTLLFSLIGTFLFLYFEWYPYDGINSLRPDQVFPWFIANILPAGLKGLLLAGILSAALSSLDSALNALATSFVVDGKRLMPGRLWSKFSDARLAQMAVLFFAIILAGLALVFTAVDSILWVGFKMAGYTYGALLGIFLSAIFMPSKSLANNSFKVMFISSSIAVFLTSLASLNGSLLLMFPWQTTPEATLLFPWQVGLLCSVLFILGFAYIVRYKEVKEHERNDRA